MHRQQRPQVQQQAKAASATASEGDTLEFWRKQVSKVSERERKAIRQNAELQRENERLREKLKEIKVLLQLSIDTTIDR